MGGHRNAGDAGVGGHDRHAAGAKRGVEGRQIDFMQAALGNIHRRIVAPRLRRAISAEMFGGRADCVSRGERRALEAADLRSGESGADARVFARAFDDASPARIARDVEHGGEGEIDAVRRGLAGRRARRALPERGVEGARFGERHGKDRLMPVQCVHCEEERHAEAGFLDGELLQPRDLLAAPDVEDAADASRANLGVEIASADRARDGLIGGQQIELAKLLLERHLRQKSIDRVHCASAVLCDRRG